MLGPSMPPLEQAVHRASRRRVLRGLVGAAGLVNAWRPAGTVRAQEVPADEGPNAGEGAGEPPPMARPLIVQIDNDPRARPSSNLGAASYVYEYTAEGGVTRFSAIFTDQDDVGPIGNIRSARLATIEIVRQFNGILFYHGGSTGIQQHIWESWIDFVSFELAENFPYFTRVPWRPRPYNSYSDLPRMRAAATQHEIALTLPARAYFPRGEYDPPDQTPPANRIVLPYQSGFQVRYEYDPSTNAYWRFMAGRPHWDDGLGAQITTQNVIVQFVPSFVTDIVEDIYGSRSLDYALQGSGPAWVFRDGWWIEALWHRPEAWSFTAYYDAKGQNIPLAPGTAWISLVAPDAPVQAWYEEDG